jgi:hypothetical protein
MSSNFTVFTGNAPGNSAGVNTGGRGVTFHIQAGAGVAGTARLEGSVDGQNWVAYSSVDETNTTAATKTVAASTNYSLVPAQPADGLAVSYWRVVFNALAGGTVTVKAQVGEL